MKGKVGSGDLEGQEAKSRLASSGQGLDTSVEKKICCCFLISLYLSDFPSHIDYFLNSFVWLFKIGSMLLGLN